MLLIYLLPSKIYQAFNFRVDLHQALITSLLMLERLAENVKLFKRSFEM